MCFSLKPFSHSISSLTFYFVPIFTMHYMLLDYLTTYFLFRWTFLEITTNNLKKNIQDSCKFSTNDILSHLISSHHSFLETCMKPLKQQQKKKLVDIITARCRNEGNQKNKRHRVMDRKEMLMMWSILNK